MTLVLELEGAKLINSRGNIILMTKFGLVSAKIDLWNQTLGAFSIIRSPLITQLKQILVKQSFFHINVVFQFKHLSIFQNMP